MIRHWEDERAPSDDEIEALLLNHIEGGRRREMIQHFRECARCRQRLRETREHIDALRLALADVGREMEESWVLRRWMWLVSVLARR